MTQPCQDSQPQEEGGRLPATKSCTSGVGEHFKFHPLGKTCGQNNDVRMLQYNIYTWQFFVTFLGWLSDPYKWLSDLQLGDEKVTLNHLVYIYIFLYILYMHTYLQ